MEKTYYTIIATNRTRHDTDDIEEVRDALRRGNDVFEVEEYTTKGKGTFTKLTISTEVDPNDFIFS